MKMSFRWFGSEDEITLKDVRQIPGMEGVVSSCFDVPADTVIPLERLRDMRRQINEHGMEFLCIESIPVHDEIKLGGKDCDAFINVWIESLRNVAAAGIPVVCYNFMLAFDWVRTDFYRPMEDGSSSMLYDDAALADMDFTREIPAWSQSYDVDSLQNMLARCRAMDDEKLWGQLRYFLGRVVPVAEELGLKLAIHPDDPPFSVMGIPRIINSRQGLERLLDLYDSPANGLAFCTGSLGAGVHNDVPAMLRYFVSKGRVNFMHVRNLRHASERVFYETAHRTGAGEMDMYELMKALHDWGFDGPLRPDHGRDIWGERGKPGYGLYDRALGASYLLGIWESLGKMQAAEGSERL